MTTNQCDIGLIGLGVMGENLALNMESKGFSVAVFNRTTEVTEKFATGRAQGKNIQPIGLTIRDALIQYVKHETAAGREIKSTLDGRFVEKGGTQQP